MTSRPSSATGSASSDAPPISLPVRLGLRIAFVALVGVGAITLARAHTQRPGARTPDETPPLAASLFPSENGLPVPPDETPRPTPVAAAQPDAPDETPASPTGPAESDPAGRSPAESETVSISRTEDPSGGEASPRAGDGAGEAAATQEPGDAEPETADARETTSRTGETEAQKTPPEETDWSAREIAGPLPRANLVVYLRHRIVLLRSHGAVARTYRDAALPAALWQPAPGGEPAVKPGTFAVNARSTEGNRPSLSVGREGRTVFRIRGGRDRTEPGEGEILLPDGAMLELYNAVRAGAPVIVVK